VYDVFFSYPHGDSEPVRELERALLCRGLEIWRDEHEKPRFANVRDAIAYGLNTSKLFLAWYSIAYAGSMSCRWELAAALAAAHRANGSWQRIVLINPENADDHIVPMELRSPGHHHVFALSADNASEIAHRLLATAALFSTPLEAAKGLRVPSWIGRPPESAQKNAACDAARTTGRRMTK